MNQKGWFAYACQHLLLIISLCAGLSCSTKPHVLEQTQISYQRSHTIHVVRQGLHTGFVVPANTIETRLPQVYESFANSPYIEFGWGDKDYYQSDKVTFAMTLKAVLWPTHSVVRVVAIPESPDIHFTDNEMQALCLDEEQYSLLIAFVEQSFLRNDDSSIIETMQDVDGNSRFYKAQGKYYLWNTCNTWTAKGLKSAGWDISPAFKITPGSVMANLEKNNDVLQEPACVTSLASE